MKIQHKEESKPPFARLSREDVDNIQILAKTGLSLRQISAYLHVPKSTIYYHAKKYSKKMTWINLAVLSEKEIGYLVGMFVGDGTHVIKTRRGIYITKFSLDKGRDEDIADYLRGLFKKAGKRLGQRTDRNSITLRLFSKEFVDFLTRYVKRVEQDDTRRKKKLLIGCEKWSQAFKLGFISGLADSDGHVYFDPKSGKRFGVLIRTSDNGLRDQIVSVLSSLHVVATTYTGKYHEKAYSFRPQYVIYIPTKELNKLSPALIAVKLRRSPAASATLS